MKIFSIRTTGDLRNRELVFLHQAPKGIGVKYSRLALGDAIAADFPPDAVLEMSPDHAGLKLATLIGNTKRFLILHREAKDVIAAEHQKRGNRWPIEYLPFTLMNQKGRPHSTDYFFVNPLTILPCLNEAASNIDYFEGDKTMVLKIHKLVLDPDKLKDAPPLFRLPEAEDSYFVDETIKRGFDERPFTNLYLDEIELQAEGGA